MDEMSSLRGFYQNMHSSIHNTESVADYSIKTCGDIFDFRASLIVDFRPDMFHVKNSLLSVFSRLEYERTNQGLQG